MPNWCWSQVHISTDEEKLNKIYEEMKKALSSNKLGADFGNEWLGNLLVYTGMDKDEVIHGHINCRGSITDFDIDDNGELMMNLETAWNPQFGAIKKFIEYVLGEDAEYDFRYTAEESGCELYCSNDDEVVDTYYIDAWNPNGDGDLDELHANYSYCDEETLTKGLIKFLEAKGLLILDGSFEELCDRVKEAVEGEDRESGFVSFHKYEYVDWLDFT